MSRASSERPRGLPPEKQLRELPEPIRLDPASDPLCRDMGEPVDVRLHLGPRLGCEAEAELRHEAQRSDDAQRIVCEARRADGAKLATLEIGDAPEWVEQVTAVEPDRHRVDREVASRHVLFELDRGVADDREVPMTRSGRTLCARRRQLDPGGSESANAMVAWIEPYADELAVNLHVLDPAVRREERLEPGLIHARHEEVLVGMREPEQLVADGAADDVGVDPETADVAADLRRHAGDSARSG